MVIKTELDAALLEIVKSVSGVRRGDARAVRAWEPAARSPMPA